MLAVDAALPVHTVLASVLSEQHPRPQLAQEAAHAAAGGGEEASVAAGGGMRREGIRATEPAALSCGAALPSLPSNVLAEVCEFEVGAPTPRAAKSSSTEDTGDDKQPAVRRQWTSPDDGWGMHLSSIPMQDLEKMPMGMPVTVGELADFLRQACEAPAEEVEAPAPNGKSGGGGERWAEPVGGEAAPEAAAAGGEAAPAERKAESGKAAAPETGGRDMLEWSLAQWRAQRLKMSGEQQKEAGAGEAPEARASRLFVEERPRAAGPVLVHQVPLAPPRPILCTDDPEASLLKAVELLLAYPELDALPIVSHARCTVVAHLTLSCCLANVLPRIRGSEMMPFASTCVSSAPEGGPPALHKFDSRAFSGETWAEHRSAEVPKAPLVMSQTQPLRDLLAFFARTHHSGVPVVEDNGSGGVLGLVSRRDLLDYLDLAMQSARRPPGTGGADGVEFDLGAPVEEVLGALRRFRGVAAEEGTAGLGAAFVTEKELTLKALPLRLLAAENRKLLFVEEGTAGQHPKLLRIISASDVWRLLIGSDQERLEAAGAEAEEPVVVEDVEASESWRGTGQPARRAEGSV